MEEWIDKQKLLLALESSAEKEQLAEKIQSLSAKECEKQGLSLLHLKLLGTRTALFGRFSISLESDRVKNKVLDQVSFKAGDEVILYSSRTSRSVNSNPTSGGKPSNSSDGADASASSITGVVSKVNNAMIEIVTEQTPEDVSLESPLRMDLRSNDYTHKKMCGVLDELGKSPHGLIPLLFGRLQLNPASMRNLNIETAGGGEFPTLNQSLNASQRAAVQGALQANYVALIHGPPGTGKTSTVTELIFQAVARQQRVLVCAPSNIAVDNILEKIVSQLNVIDSSSRSASVKADGGKKKKAGSSTIDHDSSTSASSLQVLPRVLRLGHPARISESILQHCLDSQILSDEGTEIVDDIKKEISTLRQSLVRQDTNGKRSSGGSVNYKEVRSELRALQKDLRTRETKIVKALVASKNVILCTNVGAGNRLLRDLEFDLVIIDECAQGLEASCWIPMLRGRKCVFAGDHLQLPPTIKSKEAEAGGLSTTLFERLMKNTAQFGSVSFLLDTQYRMNASICEWASQAMYHGQLKSHSSVAAHSLQDFKLRLPDNEGISMPSNESADSSESETVPIDVPVMLLLDTADCDMGEDRTEEGTSHSNAHEVALVHRHVCMLLRAGLRPADIGIITPYNAQVQLLKKKFFSAGEDEDDEQGGTKKATIAVNEDGNADNSDKLTFEGLEIRSVDGFQGGERECIILSLVRSNQSREVGFLSDHRRINVAVTRAKRHLCVICDSQTCSQDTFIGSLLRHITEKGEYRCAQELEFATDAELWAADGRPPAFSADERQQQFEKASGRYVSKSSDDPSILIEEVIDGYQKGQFAKKLRSYKLQYFTFIEQHVCENLEIVSYDRLDAVFKQSSPLVLRFPVQCSSLERRLVHQTCEARGLFHRSVGVEPRRYVEVCQVSFPSPVLEPVPPVSIEKVASTASVASVTKSTSIVTISRSEPILSTSAVISSQASVTEPEPPTTKGDPKFGPVTAHASELDNQLDSDSDEESNQSDDAAKSSLRPAAEKSKSANKKKKKNKAKSSTSTQPATKPVKYYVSEERQKALDAAQAKMRNVDLHAFDDEMAAIEAAIQANQDYANLTKYRVGASAMPNPEKTKTSNSLRSAIEEAEKARKGKATSENESSVPSTSSQHKKKVLKKPTVADIKKMSI